MAFVLLLPVGSAGILACTPLTGQPRPYEQPFTLLSPCGHARRGRRPRGSLVRDLEKHGERV